MYSCHTLFAPSLVDPTDIARREYLEIFFESILTVTIDPPRACLHSNFLWSGKTMTLPTILGYLGRTYG